MRSQNFSNILVRKSEQERGSKDKFSVLGFPRCGTERIILVAGEKNKRGGIKAYRSIPVPV
jgi:hypothetical protein